MRVSHGSTLRWIVTAVVVVGLVVDAIVHFDLASAFPQNKTSVLTEAEIFRAEAIVSLLAALLVIVRPRRYTAAIALLVGASAVAAAVVYRYVNLGTLGPVPNMYDPYWAPASKVISVVAEAAAAVGAAILYALFTARAHSSGIPAAASRPGASNDRLHRWSGHPRPVR